MSSAYSLVVADPVTSGPGFDDPPVVARLAGLPAQALEPLASPLCISLLQAREPLEKQLAEARSSMVDLIGGALPQFDAATRRFMLGVKRSCFNGREIRMHHGTAQWAELLRISQGLAERLTMLEEQLCENDRAFDALYQSELARERRHVLDLLQDQRFVRGVALARPGLVQKVRAQAPSLEASGFLKKPAKWELSLLRFVTRAAAKLSANSTLTVYALGSIEAPPPPVGLRFVDTRPREISLVRVNRPELEQVEALLLRHPAVRDRALIAWNDTVEEIESGWYRFLRAGHWDLEAGAGAFHFVPPARIKVQLSNALLGLARAALGEGALRYDTLLARLGDRISLDQLVDLGLLILMPPWPAHEARLERRIGQFLRALPDEPRLHTAADVLYELLALEAGFASAPRPESWIANMEDAFSRLLSTLVYLGGHDAAPATRASFFEDVLLEPAAAIDGEQGVLRIGSPIVREILHGANLVSRFAGLFNHRHDVLHTLAAWWREHEPSRREAAFHEIAQGFGPLWKQFLHFSKTANDSALNTFDPLQAAAIGALRETRENLLSRSRELLDRSATGDSIPAERLERLLETLPSRYAPLLGACVFVQPVDAAGTSWVLNRLHEGTGRYLSRVTPVLEAPRQQHFLSHLIARSVVVVEEEEADLLEVMHPWGSLMNAHPPQARRVLELRGLHLDLPQERRVGLGDLTIQADLDRETFRLIDRSGRRVLPVHLSSLNDAALPPLLRLLLAFGPGETRGVLPFPDTEGHDDLRISNRLTCGRLVLRRKRWVLGIQSLRADLASLADSRAYVYLYDWRRRRDLPSVGFYYERTYHGAVKPQYVDFNSPSLCSVFVSSLAKMSSGHLIFEEALPLPADFPFDGSLNRRGVELLIDSLVIRTVSGIPPPGY